MKKVTVLSAGILFLLTLSFAVAFVSAWNPYQEHAKDVDLSEPERATDVNLSEPESAKDVGNPESATDESTGYVFDGIRRGIGGLWMPCIDMKF